MTGKTKTVHVVELHGQANNLATALQTLKKGFDGLVMPPELQKTFLKLENSIGSVQRKTSKGVIPREDFSTITREIGKINTAFDTLSASVETLSKSGDKKLMSMLPPDAAQKINNVQAAYNNYTKALSSVINAEKALASALERKKETEERAASAAASERSYKGKVTIAEKELAQYAKITAALQEQKEATEALAKAQKDLDEAKKSGKSEKTIAKKEAAVKTATDRKSKADVAVQGFSDKDLKGQIAATEKLTRANEKYQAAQRATQSAIKSKTDAEIQAQAASNNLTKLKNQGSEASKQEEAALQQLIAALAQIDPQFKKLTVEGNSATEKMNFLGRTIQGLTNQQLQQLRTILGNVGVQMDLTEKETNELNQALNKTADATKKTDEAARQTEAFQTRIKQFLGLSGAAKMMRSVFRDAMKTIKELDKTMTEMAVVTDLGVGDYWEQLPEYSKRASELGVAINDAYKAATLYYQQGLKTNEVVAISTETLKMARIAGLSAEDATNKMTAALRGFNMELNETSAQKVADVYSQLAAITASDVKEISSAMTKTASIASSAGMEFETTAAFLSQIIETTRESAETAGTALKTVIARFQELKKNPAEIGEVDGEVIDANAIETALKTVGVSLRDASGQFRDLDDVFLELSKKWNTLDKNTQRYIATIAAGSRQQSRFIAMMSDYSRTQELVSSANNSAGASNQQFQKTLESLDAKLEKLKNAWHEFTMGIMDSDFIKTGVDILTKFLEIVNKATDGILGFGGAITKLVAVFGIFKLGMMIFKKFETPLAGFFKKIVTMAGLAGEESGRKMKEGVQRVAEQSEGQSQNGGDGATGNAQNNNSSQQNQQSGQQTQQRRTVAQNFKAGWAGRTQYKAEKVKLQEMTKTGGGLKQRQAAVDTAKQELAAASEGQKAAAQDKLDEANKSLADFNKQQALVQKTGKEAWGAISKGIQTVGMGVAAVGTGISMVGGLLSSLGLEEVGSVISGVGQGITMLGTALMIIPPIISLINMAISAGPIGWVILALSAIVLALTIIISLVQNNSTEKRLERAAAAADEAAKAAENAAEAYNNLVESLDGLEDKYKNLEQLRKGTEEWNKAVQEINSSVIDLINQYPELAGLVENEGGVLKIDTQSESAQNIMRSYKKAEVTATGAAFGAKLEVSRLNSDLALEKLDDDKDVLDDFETDKDVEDEDAETRKSIDMLARAAANGEIGDSEDDVKNYIERAGIASGDAAKEMAQQFIISRSSLEEYGAELNNTISTQNAYYQAMATNAQQLLDLGQYTEQAMNQMTTIVDEDLVKAYEEEEKAKMTEQISGSNDAEFDEAKEDFAKEVYGAQARVDGNKIVNEKGETLREFTDDEAWVNEIAAAEATKRAAESMEQVPGIIATSMKGLEAGLQNVLSKAFAGEDLTKGELDDFKEIMGTYTLKDADGNEVTSWDNLTAEEQKKYKNKEDYEKQYDKDYAGVTEAWDKLSDAQKKVYGWNGDSNDADSLEAAREKFEDTYTEIDREQTKAFENATKAAEELQITLHESLSSTAAQAWAQGLQEVSAGAASGEIGKLNDSLNAILQGQEQEQVDLIMAEINAMDKMDVKAWDNLAETFEELGISIPTQALKDFTIAGKAAYNAITKINFETLANDINNVYSVIDKAKQGNRTYSESDYKELIAVNKSLEKSFRQVGNDFIYVGGSIQDLTKALEKSTLEQMGEANRQLKARSDMSAIVAEKSQEYGAVEAMGTIDKMNYLTNMRSAFAEKGLDIADLGIAGLSNTTDFSKATDEQLAAWTQGVSLEGGKTGIYATSYKEGVEEANILRYSHNTSAYNAQKAQEHTTGADGKAVWGEFAKQHQEALILQAVQSGGVSDAVISSYKDAIKNGDATKVKQIGEQIAKEIGKVVESSEGREQYQELIDRVADVLADNRQKEIDKLSEINDSINDANSQIISKIQEQLDYQRQQDEIQKASDNLTDMYSQQAYLAMDTSGGGTLEKMQLDTQIEEAEKEMQQMLIDQAIQNLSDANEQAAQQREMQINLLQSQLESDIENGAITKEAADIVKNSIEALQTGTTLEATQMSKVLFGGEAGNLGDLAKADWSSSLQKSAVAAQDWFASQGIQIKNVTGNEEAKSTAGGGDVEAKTDSLKKNAIEAGKRALTNKTGGGFITQSADENSEFSKAYRSYLSATGIKESELSKETFAKDTLGLKENYNKYDYKELGSTNTNGNNWNWDDLEDNEEEEGGVTVKINGTDKDFRMRAKGGNSEATAAAKANSLANNSVFKYGNGVYIYHDSTAYTVTHHNWDYEGDWVKWSDQPIAFAQGGLADFTGPAWLDGTKSKPEYILNADQTERFFSLVDVLEKYNGENKNSSTSGNNYFEIEINVEKLDSDYDVERIADKIRKMIYEDATYRNVNAVNHIR